MVPSKAAPPAATPDEVTCQACGACCAYRADWPRFSLETDEEIARIPEAFIAANANGMACDGDRCKALSGIVGEAVACGIYAVRPLVCRDCQPGDDACTEARGFYGMPPVA
jgi:uncharacterized protein